MYVPRAKSELGPLPQLLATDGIAAVADVYPAAELAAINAVLDPFFAAKSGEARAYAWPDDMLALGIFEKILSPAMRDVLFSIVPDPVLYHMLCSEIAANSSKSHVFAEQPGGWHRDIDCSYVPHDPTHVSVTVYLTDVNPGGGTFEIVPQLPELPLEGDTPIVSVAGPAGKSFVWHRSFFHRAAPNGSAVRRRIVKFSIQPNIFPSGHLKNYYFRQTLARVQPGDPRMDTLLGRYQGREAPLLPAEHPVITQRMPPTATLGPVANQHRASLGAKPYTPRDASDLGPLPSLLARDGVARLPDIFSIGEIARINAALNPFFAARSAETKAYAWADDLLALGIFNEIITPALRDTLFSLLPDPVICHFHASEISARNAAPNIFADHPGGWHRDADAKYFANDPTHLSLFVYLTDVGAEDGALEVSPQLPDGKLAAASPVISMTGGAGLCIAWHRGFYYRERPNQGASRRRVIKISVHRNHFDSPNLRLGHFSKTRAYAGGQDAGIDFLFNQRAGKTIDIQPDGAVLPIRAEPLSTIAQTTDLIA